MTFKNVYEDSLRALEYSKLEFANTYYLAYRDLPTIFRHHVTGDKALDFGCGTGRSTRFAREQGFRVVGVDISPEMIEKARELDPDGDYRLLREGEHELAELGGGFDLVLSMFTFDNIPGRDMKVKLFGQLGALLKPTGRMVSVVSSPEIYVNEWASFTTKPFPENWRARSGDTVKIVTTDFADRRPTVDIVWSDEAYRDIYAQNRLYVVEVHKPLATGEEPYRWVNETKIAPWVIYVLGRVAE